MFNTGGPPFNAYLLLQKLPPRSYVATAVVFFAAINLLKSPGFLIAGVLGVGLLASLGWVIVVGLLFFSSALLFWPSL